MPERLVKTFVVLLCLASAAIFVAILYSQSAEYYPEYSSLRLEESGATILYESLEQSRAYRVSRSFLPLDQLHATNADILLIGVWPTSPELRSKPLLAVIEKLASNGNRVLLSIAGPLVIPGGKGTPRGERVAIDGATLQWRSSGSAGLLDRLRFEADNNWNVLRQDQLGAQAIERRYGNGSLILLADSDLFLNRTLAQNPDSAFLLSLLGGKPEVIFSESHLGVMETGSVIGLARRYRLDGLLWGLLLFAGFFLWRNIPSFPPRLPESASEAANWDDSFIAFRRLLEKSLPSAGLINYCVEARMQMEKKQAKREALESALRESGAGKDTVLRFQLLQNSLNGGRNSK